MTEVAVPVAPSSKPWVLAIDPGSEKCGYAVVYSDGTAGEKGIVHLAEIHRVMKRLCVEPLPLALAVGVCHETKIVSNLAHDLKLPVPVKLIQETNTTYLARGKYFEEHPPTGIWRFVPLGLQYPPVPVDDYAAWLIGDRFFAEQAKKSFSEGKK